MAGPQTARYTAAQQINLIQQLTPVVLPTEVLLEVEVCGVCGTDLHFFTGRWPQPSVTPGHEIVGRVRSVGAGVTGWVPGDRAVVEPAAGCGRCRFCLAGDLNLCPEFQFLSLHRDGGFGTLLAAPVECLHPIPVGMDAGVAALAEPLAVAIHACRTAGIAAGDSVLVCGAGSIGLLAVAAARELGAASVISSARHPHQREAAVRLGALSTAAEDLEAFIRGATDGAGVDIALETVGGAGQAVGQAMGAVRPGGSIVLVGGFTRPTSLLLSRVVSRELQLQGASFYSRKQSPTDFELAISMLRQARFPFASLVTHRYPLESIQEAFQTAYDKSSGAIKVQVECSGAGEDNG